MHVSPDHRKCKEEKIFSLLLFQLYIYGEIERALRNSKADEDAGRKKKIKVKMNDHEIGEVIKPKGRPNKDEEEK